MGAMWRLSRVTYEIGRSRSTIYNDITQGLFPSPVRLGKRAVGWPEDEVGAIKAARIAGKSDDEIRALVTKIHAARKTRV